jgi:hypothetical protein
MFKYILNITIKNIKANNNLIKNLHFLKTKNKNITIFKTKNTDKIITLLRSPHIYKKSREQFLYKNFKVQIEITFDNFIHLLNFILILQKILIKNEFINLKINKKCL